ncbi:hypothetical protein ABT369_25725 [Dactylosporangium sp. NPDC000244]|uniref:hypothetical protein n=1 Tax=Dactylosporangium sp. NPDC000244 TaxID=3154365 RepID=UPI003326A322
MGTEITYHDGFMVMTDDDGTATTYKADGAGKWIPIQLESEGWRYQLDSHGNPVSGEKLDDKGNPITDPKLQETVTIVNVYDRQGELTGSTWNYSDGSVVVRDGHGVPTSMTADGWTFDTFNADGHPLSGHKGELTVTITYTDDGKVVWDLGKDLPKLTYDDEGNLERMEGSDGWVYDRFDKDGFPLHGVNTAAKLTVDISRLGDGSWEYDYSDGSTLITDEHGVPIEQWVPDGQGGFLDLVFSVDLAKMRDTIELTTKHQAGILASFDSLSKKAAAAAGAWQSPAGRSYEALVGDVEGVARRFNALFDEALRRLKTAYDSYVEVEGTNYENLKSPPSKQDWTRPPYEPHETSAAPSTRNDVVAARP